MEASNLKRRSVAKGLPFLLLGIALIVAVVVYLILNPDILKDLIWLLIVVIIAIVAIAVIVIAVMVILAVPFYFLKGEQYQDGTSYDLDDVKPVTGKDKKE